VITQYTARCEKLPREQHINPRMSCTQQWLVLTHRTFTSKYYEHVSRLFHQCLDRLCARAESDELHLNGTLMPVPLYDLHIFLASAPILNQQSSMRQRDSLSSWCWRPSCEGQQSASGVDQRETLASSFSISQRSALDDLRPERRWRNSADHDHPYYCLCLTERLLSQC